MYINAEPYNFPFDEDLTPENTALIIIDMQIDFCRPGGYTAARGLDVSRNNSIVPAIQKLLEAARKVPGFTIIHTRNCISGWIKRSDRTCPVSFRRNYAFSINFLQNKFIYDCVLNYIGIRDYNWKRQYYYGRKSHEEITGIFKRL